MNWFLILKEQRQVARNIQSFKPIEVDKPFTIDEPEKNCKEELLERLKPFIDYMSNSNPKDFNLGTKAKTADTTPYVGDISYEKRQTYGRIPMPDDLKLYDNEYAFAFGLLFEIHIPDLELLTEEVCCHILEVLKNPTQEKIGVRIGNSTVTYREHLNGDEYYRGWMLLVTSSENWEDVFRLQFEVITNTASELRSYNVPMDKIRTLLNKTYPFIKKKTSVFDFFGVKFV